MNFEPLYNQIALLNQNIQTLIGALAATGGGPVAANNTPAAPAAPAAEPEKKTSGRPKTRYYRTASGSAVKSSGDAPEGATEIDKAEYDKLNLEAAKAATDSKGAQPGSAASDPFGDDEPAASVEVTIDDVRTSAFAVRDKKGEAVAKAIIGKFADKLANVKAEQYAKLKKALDDALNGGDDL